MAARSARIVGPVAALSLVLLAAPASYGTPTPRVAVTASPEVALAKVVAGYQRSVTSPWLNADGRLTDVAVVEARLAAPSSVEVLEYRAPLWWAVQRIALPSGSVYLAPGHFTAASKAPPEWLRSFYLTPGRPGVAFYITGASGWGGLVVGKPAASWGVVPFQGYGTGLLPYPEVSSPSDVVTSANDCKPNCASGHFTSRHFRFDVLSGTFLQVGPTASVRGPGRYPKP